MKIFKDRLCEKKYTINITLEKPEEKKIGALPPGQGHHFFEPLVFFLYCTSKGTNYIRRIEICVKNFNSGTKINQ